MLTGIYRINYFHFRHRGNAPTDYKQCTGNDVYTYFYCKFYMPNICSVTGWQCYVSLIDLFEESGKHCSRHCFVDFHINLMQKGDFTT